MKLDLTDESTAYHEAGHAAVALFFGHDLEVVTIDRDGDAAGHAAMDRAEHDALRHEDEERRQVVFERAIMVGMAGVIAQRRVAPSSVCDEHDAADRAIAIEYFEELDIPTQDVLEAYWRVLELRTEALVNRLWPRIERLAAALLARKTLTGEEAAEAAADPEVRTRFWTSGSTEASAPRGGARNPRRATRRWSPDESL